MTDEGKSPKKKQPSKEKQAEVVHSSSDDSEDSYGREVLTQASSLKKKKATKRKRSMVWKCFDPLPVVAGKKKEAKCMKCGYVVGCDSKHGTGNMLKHMKFCERNHNIKQMIVARTTEGGLGVRDPGFDHQVFRELITSAVVRHNLPLQFVEYEGIREAFFYANPSAKLVSRNTLKSDILACYKSAKKNLFDMLQCYRGKVCLTSDLWTSVATDGYITLTAHFITDDWVLQKRLLNFSYIPSPHTGITISDKIYKLLVDWKVDLKLFSITLDNASNNNSFVDTLKEQLDLRNALLCKGKYFHIRCCAHILNLIVQEGLKDMNEAIVKVRETVKYIKGSQGRRQKFMDCIEQAGLNKRRGLRQDVPTRWNSTYLMLDSALYFRRAFVHLQLTDSNYKHSLSVHEWDRVESLCKFLGVFYNVTRLFSGTQYPTANLYFPNVYLVESTILKTMEDSETVMRSLAEKMKPKFDKYWADYSIILAIAVVFDPRYKIKFVEFCYKKLYGDGCDQIKQINAELRSLFDLYKNSIGVSRPARGTLTLDEDHSVQYKGESDFEEFDKEDEDLNSIVEKTELDKYLEEKRLNRNDEIEVLEYWKTNQYRYPNLALMARDVLSIPISTVASESAFSIGGRVLDQYRSSLAHNVVESLICTRDWKFSGVDASDFTWEELTEDIMEAILEEDSGQGSNPSVR